MRMEDEKVSLKVVQVAENTYRVFNTRTNRFHNPELGIDEVF
jgi:hypothetical protein